MKNIGLLLAWRYVLGTHRQTNISAMVLVSFIGILIGSCALALTLSIMNGFEKVTLEKLQGIHPSIIMRSYGSELHFDAIAPVLEKEFPHVVAFSPTTTKQAIIQSHDEDEINVVMVRGIDPVREPRITSIDKKITRSLNNEQNLSDILSDGKIAIGTKLAENLEVGPGDHIRLAYTQDEQTKHIKFEEIELVIGGIFNTGIEEFDAGLVMCSLDLIGNLWPDAGITTINIKVDDAANEQEVITALRNRFNIEVYSWKDLYPALVSALKLEKYVMFFILALITLVASMNIISLEFMHITQKRGDIAILKALGMADATITSIFLGVGIFIAAAACVTGLLLATLAGWFLQHYPFITLPDVYYVSHLPVKMEFHLFALVFVLVMLLALLATWIPAHRTRSIVIADILRFEA